MKTLSNLDIRISLVKYADRIDLRDKAFNFWVCISIMKISSAGTDDKVSVILVLEGDIL